MTQKLLSTVQFWMVIIGGCLLLICAPIAVCGQGETGKVSSKPTTAAKPAPAKSSKPTRKSSTASKGSRIRHNAKDSLESRDNSQSLENKSPSWHMVGVWRANGTEFGYNLEMTFTANADGTYQFVARSAQGTTVTDYGTWQYSDGILYQRFSNGASGKGSVAWIDSNTFDLTIIDNGTPAYSGKKRRYYRVK